MWKGGNVIVPRLFRASVVGTEETQIGHQYSVDMAAHSLTLTSGRLKNGMVMGELDEYE